LVVVEWVGGGKTATFFVHSVGIELKWELLRHTHTRARTDQSSLGMTCEIFFLVGPGPESDAARLLVVVVDVLL